MHVACSEISGLIVTTTVLKAQSYHGGTRGGWGMATINDERAQLVGSHAERRLSAFQSTSVIGER